MAITEEQIVEVVVGLLLAAANFVPPPVSTILFTLAQLAKVIQGAVNQGGTPESIVTAVEAAIVNLADAEMKTRLGP